MSQLEVADNNVAAVGYPMGRIGPVRRVSLADVAYEDQWGRPTSGL
jgi:hypothetical protein